MARLHRCLALVAVLTAGSIGTNARANVDVGDKPTLKFTAFDSKAGVDLADLKGKIVVVDFWATWCHPCMAEAPHMVAINKKYTDQGVQFIGISLDSEPDKLKTVIKEQHFTWPMSYEGKGWDGSYPKNWGVTGIPQTFIIGPDGTVLWRGHPASIDAPLEKALKEHPPQLVSPQTLSTAKTSLDQFDLAMAANDTAKAVKALASVPEAAKLDSDTAIRIKDATQKLNDAGKAKLDAVDTMLADKNYGQAITELQNLSRVFNGTETSVTAKKKLASLGSDPNVKKEIASAKTADAAAAALKVADKAKADHKDDKAYPLYQKIVKMYPGTPSADTASAAVTAYEADTAFITKYSAAQKAAKAESILTMANADRSSGSLDKAKTLYKQIVTDYAGTPSADAAKSALEQIGE